MNNTAIIAKLTNVRPHSNADRLQCATIFGDQIIVGLDVKEGDIGIYFDSNLCLSDEFLKNNNLYKHKEKNIDPTQCGMFEDNGKVKCLKLRGEKSYGFWIPLKSLSFAHGKQPWSILEEGFEFNTFNDIPICKKYVVQRTPGAPGSKKLKQKKARVSRIIDGQFKFHEDTDQLAKNIHQIHPDDVIVLSWKMHGTSAIASNCLTKRDLNWYEKLLIKFKVQIQTTKYDSIYASRRVIKNEFESSKQHYYSEDLWTKVGQEKFGKNLYEGETIYYEIVGYTSDGGMIQKPFDYFCEPGTYKIYVYRITQTNVSGKVIELSWPQLQHRCNVLNVDTVPLIYYGQAKYLFPDINIAQHWNVDFLDRLRNTYVYDQDSKFCKTILPEEGIVLRKEGYEIEAYKLKNFRFLNFESDQKDKGTEDIEDQN